MRGDHSPAGLVTPAARLLIVSIGNIIAIKHVKERSLHCSRAAFKIALQLTFEDNHRLCVPAVDHFL